MIDAEFRRGIAAWTSSFADDYLGGHRIASTELPRIGTSGGQTVAPDELADEDCPWVSGSNPTLPNFRSAR
jgi:hypothetical protein